MKSFTTRVLVLALVGLIAAGGVAFGEDDHHTHIDMTYRHVIDLTKGLTDKDAYTMDHINGLLRFHGDVNEHQSYQLRFVVADAAVGFGAVTARGDFTTDILGTLGIESDVSAKIRLGNINIDNSGHGIVTRKEWENIAFERIYGGSLALIIGSGPVELTVAALHDFSESMVNASYSEGLISIGGFLAPDSSDIGVGAEVALGEQLGIPALDVGFELEIDGSDSKMNWGAGLNAQPVNNIRVGVAGITDSSDLAYVGADVELFVGATGPLPDFHVLADLKYDIRSSTAADKALDALGIDVDFGAFEIGIDLRSGGADVQNAYINWKFATTI